MIATHQQYNQLRTSLTSTLQAAVAHSERINQEISELDQAVKVSIDSLKKQHITPENVVPQLAHYKEKVSVWTSSIQSINAILNKFKILCKKAQKWIFSKKAPAEGISPLEQQCSDLFHKKPQVATKAMSDGQARLSKLHSERKGLFHTLQTHVKELHHLAKTSHRGIVTS